MKGLVKAFSIFFLFLLMVSCDNDDSIYAGFKKMENGSYMKFYSKGESEIMPRINDEVTIRMAQYFDDSLLFDTDEKPMTLVLKEADFVGDVADGILMMHVGDSARLVVMSDSVLTMLMGSEIPMEYAGKPIYYDMKLLSVKPYEVLEAERKVLVDSLKVAEVEYLSLLRENPNNTITESGLIILEQTGKGKKAKISDYVNFDFKITTPAGDTIMNSFGRQPVEVQYGEEFICKGFTDAIGMVPEDGMLRFVIPSEMAFDSAGYESYIKPYTPLDVVIKMNGIMDKAAYEKKMADMVAEQEAEKARSLAVETKAMEEYIKENGITVAPTESGLYFLQREEGKGNLAQWGDVVSIHSRIYNLKGDLIDSSYDFDEPISFKIGQGEMLPAIEEALMTMASGAKVTMLSPSELAFGERDFGEFLPAYSPLLIELELLEIK